MDKPNDQFKTMQGLDAAMQDLMATHEIGAIVVRERLGRKLRWRRRLRIALPLLAVGLPAVFVLPILWSSLGQVIAAAPNSVNAFLPDQGSMLDAVRALPLVAWVTLAIGAVSAGVVLSER